MMLNERALRWLRDVAMTVAILVAGVSAFSVVSGEAYGGLPGARSARPATALQVAEASPHGPQPECSACHRSHSAAEAPLLRAGEADSVICTRCHSAGGDAPAVSTHANLDYAYATQPAFTTTCGLCHDPHGDPAAGNRAMVRSSIAGLPVAFARHDGADSFDDGLDDAVHDSICVVCHTATSHNNVFSADLLGQGHAPVGGNCTSCHPHGGDPSVRSGFMPNAPLATATASATPTATDIPTETATSTPPPTDTPAPLPSPTEESTATSVPLPTGTPEPPTETPTASPTATP